MFNAIVSSEKPYLCKDPGFRSMRKVTPGTAGVGLVSDRQL